MTTRTFQGLNTESRPSSRVLNPPGGSSSNIFGGYDNQQLQRTPAQTNPESINRVKNSDVGRGPQAAAATGPRAPRCGEPNEQAKGRSEQPQKPGNDIQPSAVVSSESVSSKAATESSSHIGPNLGSSMESISLLEKPRQETAAPDRHQQGGIFGGKADDVKEHRSTRVTQPPGGRSTKLW